MINGKCFVFSDHVDTDVIIPARYLTTPNPLEYSVHCMEDIDKNFISNVACGDIIVAGENFGCGSSREHAPVAIKTCGISCVIAKSFARIFFRNAINVGLPVLECKEAVLNIKAGDVLQVQLEQGTILNCTTGKSFTAVAYPKFMQDVISVGGLVAYTANKLKEHKNENI